MSENNEQIIVLVDPSHADNYTCAICLQLMENPKETPCCRHAFCTVCITRELSIRPGCPTCRTPTSIFDMLEASIVLKKELAKIEVHCINRCDWKGNRDELRIHLANECESQLWPCPNSKILDFPACQEKFFKSTKQSHLSQCPFEKLKPFFGALLAHCSTLATEANNTTELCNKRVGRSEDFVKHLESVVENCHLSRMQSSLAVSELTKVVDNCDRVIRESTKIRCPLPPTPTISGNHYITVVAECHSGTNTSVVVPGCTYSEGRFIQKYSRQHGLERRDIHECMAAVNIIAKLGYSIADSSWSYDREVGLVSLTYWMEYTGVEWNNDATQSDDTLPAYVQIWHYENNSKYPIGMEPTMQGCPEVKNSKSFRLDATNLVNLLIEKHSYRIVQYQGMFAMLLQKCPLK